MRLRIWIGLAILLLVTLACGLPQSASSIRPPTLQPPSADEMQQAQDNLIATLQSPDEQGDITLTITEGEINAKIAEQMGNQPADLPIKNPQVHLANGQVEIYGEVSQSGFKVDAKLVVVPTVNADGQPELTVQSATLGSLPVPEVLLKQMNAQISEQLAQALLGAGSDKIHIKTIVVTEGLVTLTGEKP